MADKREDITFQWAGKDLTLPARNVWPTIKQVEAHITYMRLTLGMARQDVPNASLAEAFATVCQICGREVSAEDVYDKINTDVSEWNNVALTLMAILAPPAEFRKMATNMGTAAQTPGKSQAADMRTSNSIRPPSNVSAENSASPATNSNGSQS